MLGSVLRNAKDDGRVRRKGKLMAGYGEGRDGRGRGGKQNWGHSL